MPVELSAVIQFRMKIKMLNCVVMGGIKRATIENPWVLILHTKYKYYLSVGESEENCV